MGRAPNHIHQPAEQVRGISLEESDTQPMERSEQRPQQTNHKRVGVKEGTLGNMGSEGVQEIMGGHFGKYGIRRGTGNLAFPAPKI